MTSRALTDAERIERLEHQVQALDHALHHILSHVSVTVSTGHPLAPTSQVAKMTLGEHYARTVAQRRVAATTMD